jgi:hypothetical protein
VRRKIQNSYACSGLRDQATISSAGRTQISFGDGFDTPNLVDLCLLASLLFYLIFILFSVCRDIRLPGKITIRGKITISCSVSRQSLPLPLRSEATGALKTACIGFSISPFGRMNHASGSAMPTKISRCYAISLLISCFRKSRPGSASMLNGSKPAGTTPISYAFLMGLFRCDCPEYSLTNLAPDRKMSYNGLDKISSVTSDE